MFIMELDETKFNLGRVLVALDLENKILQNLTEYNIPDRIAIAKGVLAGYLEDGEWEKVVSLVYDSSPVNALLERTDREKLKNDILESAQKNNQNLINRKTKNLLCKFGEMNLMYQLAINADFNFEDTESLINSASSVLSEKEKLEGYRVLFARAENWNDQDSIVRRIVETNNKMVITETYENLLKKKDPHFESAVILALADKEKKKERWTAIVRMFSDQIERNYQLYLLSKEHNFPLTREEQEKLRDNAVGQISIDSFTPKRGERIDLFQRVWSEDQELRVAWAKKHRNNYPNEAYKIFVKEGYEGNERLVTVVQGLQTSKIEVSEIQSSDLDKILQGEDLGLKVKIARFREDKELLRELSKEYQKLNDLEVQREAYALWLAGNGDLNDESFKSLRETLINAELGKDSPYFSWLLNNDTEGCRQVYDKLLPTKPGKAYEIARNKLCDDILVSKARERIVEVNNPKRVYDYFKGKEDQIGIDLAVTVLAKMYDITEDMFAKYLDVKEEIK